MTQLQSKAGPTQVVEWRDRLIETSRVMATCTVATREGAQRAFLRCERAAVGVDMTSFTGLLGATEDATGLRVRREHSGLLDGRQEGIMAGLAGNAGVALLQIKTGVRVRINIKGMRRKTVAIMAA